MTPDLSKDFEKEYASFRRSKQIKAAAFIAVWAIKIFALAFCAAIFAEAFCGFFTTEF